MQKRGFSLMEMMVVMLIVAVIAAATAPMINKKLIENASGDSPWIWTSATDNSIAYNIRGNEATATIGKVKPKEDLKQRLHIQSDGDKPQITLGNENGITDKLLRIMYKSANTATADGGYIGISANEKVPAKYSVVIGHNATALDAASIAIGDNAVAAGQRSVSIGGSWLNPNSAKASGIASIALGEAQALGNNDIAIGLGAKTAQQTGGLDTASIAIGSSANTTSQKAIAIGKNARAANKNAIAIGGLDDYNNQTLASSEDSIAIGTNAITISEAKNSIAIGTKAMTNSEAKNAIAIGASAVAASKASGAIVIGAEAKTRHEARGAIAIGSKTEYPGNMYYVITEETLVEDTASIAIGSGAQAKNGEASIAIGPGAKTESSHAIAIGNKYEGLDGIKQTVASGSYSVAIGDNAKATHAYSVALGKDAQTTTSNQIVLGNANTTVYIPGKLVVESDSYLGASTSATNYIRLRDLTSGSKNNCHMYKMYVNDTWDIGWIVDVESGEYKDLGTTNGIRNMPSDRRLKDVGEVFNAGLEEVKKLEVFNYTFKKDPNKTPRVGVMAQDLEKIFPKAVMKGDDGFLRIRMEDMFYAVVNAIKELDTKITAIVEEVKTAVADIADLKIKSAEYEKTIAELVEQNKAQAKALKDLEKRLAKLEKKASKVKELDEAVEE